MNKATLYIAVNYTVCVCVSLTDKAPLSKSLLLVLNGLTVMLTLLPQYQDLFVYHLQAITQEHQVRPGIYKCVGG